MNSRINSHIIPHVKCWEKVRKVPATHAHCNKKYRRYIYEVISWGPPNQCNKHTSFLRYAEMPSINDILIIIIYIIVVRTAMLFWTCSVFPHNLDYISGLKMKYPECVHMSKYFGNPSLSSSSVTIHVHEKQWFAEVNLAVTVKRERHVICMMHLILFVSTRAKGPKILITDRGLLLIV